MNKEKLEAKVKWVVGDQLGYDECDINMESNFVEDFGADSLDEVELVMAFEEEFDIEISDEEAEKIKTVSQAVDYIFSVIV